MIGLGTVINVVAIILGGLIGLFFGKLFKENIQKSVTSACGVCTLFIGLGGAVEKMLVIADGSIKSIDGIKIVICIVLGTVIGEFLRIETGIEKFGEWLKIKTKNAKDTGFVNAFVTASATVCIGAMAVIGSINDAVLGDISILTAKSVLDFIIIIVMTAALGKGCIFSAVSVGIFQGVITLFAKFLEPVMTASSLSDLSLIGSIIIFCIGINLIFGKKFNVANMLPSILLAVIWTFLF